VVNKRRVPDLSAPEYEETTVMEEVKDFLALSVTLPTRERYEKCPHVFCVHFYL